MRSFQIKQVCNKNAANSLSPYNNKLFTIGIEKYVNYAKRYKALIKYDLMRHVPRDAFHNKTRFSINEQRTQSSNGSEK